MMRMIEIEGEVLRLGLGQVLLPLSGREAALQRLLLSLYNRPGSSVATPLWGAGVKTILGARISLTGDARSGEIVDRLNASLVHTERDGDPWKIASVSLISTTKRERGRSIRILVSWANQPDEQIQMEVT